MTMPDIGFTAQRAVQSIARRDTPIRSDGMRRDDETRPARVQVTTPEFAALLAVLATAGAVTRSPRQTPTSSPTVSLLDRVLDGAAVADNVDSPLIDASVALTSPEAALLPTTTSATHANAQAVSDRLRYGILTDSAADAVTEPASPRSNATAIPTRGRDAERESTRAALRDETRIDGRARNHDASLTAADVSSASLLASVDAFLARSRATFDTVPETSNSHDVAPVAQRASVEGLLSMTLDRSAISPRDTQTVAPTRGTSRRNGARDAVARLLAGNTSEGKRASARRGMGVEELLAMGDSGGADVRRTLDALLAHAGTSLGAQIADAASSESRNAAMNVSTGTAAGARTASERAPVRDPSALDVEFRARLDRVVSRMHSEFGHEVQLVETVRSQDRQDYLFAQGRTRNGDVVTWTRDSAHTRGEAADVMVDGSWNNSEGYARLQRIAREEGLRTLGARDPGHLELPSDVLRADVAATVDRSATSAATRDAAPGGQERAGVAAVAGVASVARVSAASDAPTVDRNALAAYTVSATGLADSRTRDAATRDSRDRNADRGDGEAPLSERHARRAARSGEESAPGATTWGPANPTTATSATPLMDRAPTTASAGSTDRVADAQQRRDDAPAVAMSRMSLDVEGVDGMPQRVTVDLRGNVVDTHITTDAASADGMRLRTGELQEALERRGLESDSVRISAVGRSASESERSVAAERTDLRLTATPSAAFSEGSAQQGQRERSSSSREWERYDDARRARDEQRQGSGQRGRRDTPNQDAS